MTYIETWDETKPAGSRDANLGDDDIREFKRALRERLAGGGMYYPSTDDSDAGKFSYVNYLEQSADPTSVADEGFTYTKDVSGVTELYYMDSAGTVVQLTTGGAINGAAFGNLANIPSGAGVIPIANLASGTPDGTQFVRDDGALAVPGYADPVFEQYLLHIKDLQTANTAGQALTASDFRTARLNTESTNEITGASLSSNVITLPSGTYFIHGWVMVYGTDKYKSRLRNTSDGSTTLVGAQGYTGSAGADHVRNELAFITGRFTIAAEKNFEIQVYPATTGTQGTPANFSEQELYADICIWKVA